MKKILALSLFCLGLSLNAKAAITTTGSNCNNPNYSAKYYLVKSFIGDSLPNSVTVVLDQSSSIKCTAADIQYCTAFANQVGRTSYIQICPNTFNATIR